MTKQQTSKKSVTGLLLLNLIKLDFIGLDTHYTIATGESTRRIYLDSTASTLMMGPAYRSANQFLEHYANTHSNMHFSARISTESFKWAHDRILKFVGADSEEYTCFFTGSGTTSGMNRIARAFKHYRPEREVVLVSIMEHHSNDLPHRKHGGKVIHIPVDTHESKMGCIDLDMLEKYLKLHKHQVNYVSVTGISNVTGIINPINQVAELAHRYDAFIVVDGAQMVAHVPVKMGGHKNPLQDVDALIFSGHKTYAPGSPGVVIVKKSLISNMEPEEVGGGMVDRVFPDRYFVKEEFPDREEAGTPNIFGAVLLGSAVHILDKIGMGNVLNEDMSITNKTLQEMLKMSEIIIYGDTDYQICPRAGSISFNIKGMNHGLVAAILNDYFNIAVRNECFCAHPYVEKMLELTHASQIKKAREQNLVNWHTEPWMGMVRASFGLYSSENDVEHFIHALWDMIEHQKKYEQDYFINEMGDYEHKTFKFSSFEYFSPNVVIDHSIIHQKK